jgi:urease accessory protein
MTSEEPGGRLDLRFALGSDGRTALVRREHRFPFHFTTPLYLDGNMPGMAFVYVQNPTGGVFGGDRLELSVAADAGAAVHVTTTSATKVYRTEGEGAVQRVSLAVGTGAFVEYIPEPLIPQAGSRYEQDVAAVVDEEGALLIAETLAPGRVAHGEAFAYDRLLLRTAVRTPEADVCAETVLLEPTKGRPDRRGLLGEFPYLSTLLAVAPGRDSAALADALDDAVRDLGFALGAAGTLPREQGALVRVLARSSPAVTAALAAAWQAARMFLLGHAPPRRRK